MHAANTRHSLGSATTRFGTYGEDTLPNDPFALTAMVFGTTGIVMLALQLAAPAAGSDAPLKHARSAQERFESTRRAHLPRERAGHLGRSCDAVIGRFCYWYDSTETVRAPEPPRIVSARRSLLSLLDSLARQHPGNDWIAGQRVRYSMEDGDTTAARHAANECGATPWWCAALSGLVHHVAQRYADADAAYDRALAAMPAEQRCEWMDLRRHILYAMASPLKRASCETRAEAAERLWRVSQPLWSVGGNDLRTEHFARQTMALVLARSANPHGIAWSSDIRELMLRYGWSEWFTRAERSPYQLSQGGITGHDREPSYFMFPTTSSARAPIQESSWAFRDATMPSRYAPRHIEWMGELSHQLVRLPRGDSLRLLAVTRVRDTALARDSVALYLGALQGDERSGTRTHEASAVALLVPNQPALVSIEVLGAQSRRAERARYDVAAIPCARRCLSDLLLFAAVDGDTPVTLDQATRRAFAGRQVAAAQPLGVYWEIGDGRDAPALRDSLVWATVSVEPERVSVARRTAARLRLASTPTAVKLRWQMQLASSGHVTLRLPANARGRYRIRLAIDGVGTSERAITLQ